MKKNGLPQTRKGRPVKDFPMEFEWLTGDWFRLFEEQTALIQSDIARARAEDKLVVYLSCPISGRGGGWHGTNVDIAKHTERRLLSEWGERFWILNPSQYQMESKAGAGLIDRHAKKLNINLDKLKKEAMPGGGDYMRMWTRVLVEDSKTGAEDKLLNTGRNFDAFYFIGPTDARSFFTGGDGMTVTAGVEEYFARKFAADPDFRDSYSVHGIVWGADDSASEASKKNQAALKVQWEASRKNFFRFYAVRASINFSLGSHDEWNIFRLLNEKRRHATVRPEMPSGDPSEQIAGFFDGKQISPAATETVLSAGYAIK